MPVEAYALVVMKRGQFRVDMEGEYDLGGVKWTRDDKISFCRIRLVDGRGKVPRWEVVEDYGEEEPLSDETCEEGEYLEYPYARLKETIDDRRVTLKQIQQLFPETKSMPFGIALDYVRDKI